MKKFIFFLILPFLIVIFIIGLFVYKFRRKTYWMDFVWDITEYLIGVF